MQSASLPLYIDSWATFPSIFFLFSCIFSSTWLIATSDTQQQRSSTSDQTPVFRAKWQRSAHKLDVTIGL
ncbi:hypothetical protein I7I50_09945 [Histoplasma capsulatum G186AR]|uniref:Uncharacterized protein n=1 Tax=Ajellomyces capsulatus TaxID=5037 RepID=A0A8H8D627_AJECA|nr:hypothetical protein I7I52_01183 [Histoplasma capsulatum]QSS68843.1 hypothetical protein I7I50_09945 [Histoplasma capsulatum G186AR]